MLQCCCCADQVLLMQRYVPCQGFAETKYQGLVGQLGFTVSCVPAEISVHSEPAIFIPIMRVQG